MFNREWMLKSAQTFGSPFVDVTYKPGTQPNELAKLDQEIAAGLANRFIRHVEGTIINVSPAQAKTGAGNNQMMLMELADKHVCELFLGSEGTTKMTPGKMGGSQQNSSQENTKRERVEGLARWVAAEPLQQLARAILLVNYGEDSECPTIAADFTEIQDPMEAAQRMQIICAPGMPPIVADEFYDAMKLTKPEPDDQVILGGKIGLMGDTEQEIDPNPQQPEAPQPALDENNNPLPAQKINPEDAALQMKMAKAKVKGSDFELGEFIYGGAPRGNRNAAKDYQAGQEVKFEGTAADGSGTSGMFPVKIVNPHSNADKVTHSDKRGREYEGAFSHISTATVENIRSGKQFEAHHFSLSAPPVKASHRSTDLKTLLGHASDDDIAELQDLVKAAEQATHMNGEHNRVKAKLQELQDKLS